MIFEGVFFVLYNFRNRIAFFYPTRKMHLKPTIKKPCSADWSQMKIGLNSRFCSSCEKSVVDFTAKSREEIIEYLLIHSGKNTCGRFYKKQLDYSSLDFEIMVRSIAEKQKDPRTGLSILIIGSMLAISCQNPSTAIVEKNSQPISVEDTIEMAQTAADSLDTDTISNKLCTKDTNGTTQEGLHNEPDSNLIEIIVGEVVMGDIAIDIPIDPGDTASTQPRAIIEPVQYIHIEQKPEFPGGMDSLMCWVATNTKYPQSAQQVEIEGRVFVEFIIDKSGKVTHPKIVRGVHKELDSAAITTIASLPNWTPGEMNGQKVDVVMIIPVSFKL